MPLEDRKDIPLLGIFFCFHNFPQFFYIFACIFSYTGIMKGGDKTRKKKTT